MSTNLQRENDDKDSANDDELLEEFDEDIDNSSQQQEYIDDDDDGNFRNNNDEPFAEGEEGASNDDGNNDIIETVISEEMSSSMKFYTLCNALELIWKNPKWNDVQKLWKILPPKFLKHLNDASATSTTPAAAAAANSSDTNTIKRERVLQSIFPILRLLMPEKDGTRQFQMAESTISILYGNALGLSKQSNKFNMLLYYTDPHYVANKAQGLGDLSIVVQTVVGSTKTSAPSSYTVGQINVALDVLSSLPSKARQNKSNHDWKKKESSSISIPEKKSSKGTRSVSLKDLRVQWLQQLNEGYNFTFSKQESDRVSEKKNNYNQGLSPLEHKWLVRILLKKMQFGLGWKKLLQWYNPYAAMLWSAHNSLKGICSKICDPEFSKARETGIDPGFVDSQSNNNNQNENIGLSSYMPQSFVAPQFGIVFSPMLSERTGFGRILNDISHRHRNYIQSDDVRKQYPYVPRDCLAFLHPAFCVEPKLDGERFLVHLSRDGVVKMHTRRGNWYSELYAPVLGPAIRRAVHKGLDVILDGEVIAWDSYKEETVPFGSNRTIAKLRTDYMAKNNKLDPRDRGMHIDDTSNKSMNSSNSFFDLKNSLDEDAGSECWLQYIIFDLIYINGPEASNILSQTVSNHILPRPTPGSIIHLEALERKTILYRIIDPQSKEVEIVTTWIIRPNGRTDIGETYFHSVKPTTEYGYAAKNLDSLSYNLSGKVASISSIDAERRFERSDEQISKCRAQAIQRIYDLIVEEQRLEGLVFKDLSTPYFLGEESKVTRYWHKFKPDYFNGSAASDLDVVIIGAYYATGLRNSGKPSSLLCACVDSDDPEAFLPVVKVNFNSIDAAQVSDILRATGYRKNDSDDGNKSEEDDGTSNPPENKWTKSDWASKYYPDFISRKSFQPNHENSGWRAQKKDYPDLWIHPHDSVVVTLNAGEIVVSDVFSAGITLRFPRITKVRTGADSKDVSDIESEESLREKYWDVQKSRSNTTAGFASISLGSPTRVEKGTSCRFLTEKQYHESFRKRRVVSRRAKSIKSIDIPVAEVVSNILNGISVAILGGSGFVVTNGSLEYDEAQEEGWQGEVNQFTNVQSLIKFIKAHSGKYKISVDSECTFVLGGNINDAKVVNYIRSIEHARTQSSILSHKATSKKGKEIASIARSDGVLRWTFIVSLVHRWLATGHRLQETIVDIDPDFMKPTLIDYLVRPKPLVQVDALGPPIDARLYEADLSSVTKMRRALEIVKASKSTSSPHSPSTWNRNCMDKLTEAERWIAASKRQILWPYERDYIEQSLTVTVYPDIFNGLDCNDDDGEFVSHTVFSQNDLGSDLTSDWILSVIPLLRVMGAFIASNLHLGVTHVLCDIIEAEIEYSSGVDESIFTNRNQGVRLLQRLKQLDTKRLGIGKLMLISPNWVRKRKWG